MNQRNYTTLFCLIDSFSLARKQVFELSCFCIDYLNQKYVTSLHKVNQRMKHIIFIFIGY